MTKGKKRGIIFTVVLLALLSAIFYICFYFPFADDGVKTGELNYVVRKGIIFKTYEGKIIQSGLRSTTPGSMQSYEFEFSIQNPAIAKRLMMMNGREVALHYKEYFFAIPWRGYSKFIVDSIVQIRNIDSISPEFGR